MQLALAKFVLFIILPHFVSEYPRRPKGNFPSVKMQMQSVENDFFSKTIFITRQFIV